MKTITLFGGFHASDEINVRVGDNVYQALKRGEMSIWEPGVLSNYQRRRLDNHFCGIDGCTCGGVSRASIDFND